MNRDYVIALCLVVLALTFNILGWKAPELLTYIAIGGLAIRRQL